MSDASQKNTALKLWSFPLLENSINKIALPQAAESSNDKAPIINDDVDNTPENTQPLSAVEAHKLHDQITILDAIGLQMKQVFSELDAELLTNMLTMMKKTVKKIILKEIAIDENAIKNMVADSLEQIHSNDELCVVSLSEADADIFKKSPPLSHVEIKVDPTFASGDYSIKTKYSQLDAFLEQRLNRLFGI